MKGLTSLSVEAPNAVDLATIFMISALWVKGWRCYPVVPLLSAEQSSAIWQHPTIACFH